MRSSWNSLRLDFFLILFPRLTEFSYSNSYLNYVVYATAKTCKTHSPIKSNFMLHRMHNTDAAYRYRLCGVVCNLYVCLYVGHTGEPCKNG